MTHLAELQAKTNAELNRIAAVECMEWREHHYSQGGRDWQDLQTGCYISTLWSPTTDLNATRRLVLKCEERGLKDAVMYKLGWFSGLMTGWMLLTADPRDITIACILAWEESQPAAESAR